MKLEDKVDHIRKIERYLEQESLLVAENSIDTRLKIKKLLGEKVNILFICHRPEVWNSLKTVYEAFLSDPTFAVQILVIPNKKQLPEKGFSHEEYESEGAEEFWKGEHCIQGYDYQKDEWLDPRDLHPDYVFLQQPYNITRAAKYKSWMISKYAKLCYVTYVYGVFDEEALAGFHPEDFLTSTSFYFAPDYRHYEYICERLKNMNNFFTRSHMTGFPRFDLHLSGEKKRTGAFRALWTPRWSTVEGHSFFFEYKDFLLSYCDQHDSFSLTFRPHPQSFLEWNATGLMTKEEIVAYKSEYEKRKNAQIDTNKDYLISFQEVDCFITDLTSLMVEYLITGKPIIYCHRADGFSEMGRKLAEGYYWVRNKEELIQTLEMLSSGMDPLMEKRKALVQELFYIPEQGAGLKIKEIIKEDALK